MAPHTTVLWTCQQLKLLLLYLTHRQSRVSSVILLNLVPLFPQRRIAPCRNLLLLTIVYKVVWRRLYPANTRLGCFRNVDNA